MSKATCPVCDADVSLQENVQESEIVSCNECHSRLVVDSIKDSAVTLSKAPEVEEDWGE